MPDISDLADICDSLFDEISAAVEAVRGTIVGFGERALEGGAEWEERRQQYRQVQLNAMRTGDASPWLAILDVEGRAYARLGTPFRDWVSLIRASRRVIRRHIAVDPRQSDLLDAMDEHYDMAIVAFGQSYRESDRRQRRGRAPQVRP
jgi:hypothetical protein